MTIFLPSNCHIIYTLRIHDFTQLRRLFLKSIMIYHATWIMEIRLCSACWIFLLRFGTVDHGKVYTYILGFLTQLVCGLVRICQTNTKGLTYMVHGRAPNIFNLEFHRNLLLELFFSASILHHLVESLLTVTQIITYMLMTRNFINHFHQRIHKHLYRL